MGYTIKDHWLYKGDERVSIKPSPNYGGKIKSLDYIVIHYDGTNGLGGLQWLTQKGSQVSAHLWISKSGVVWQLLPFNVIGWHAGRGEWDGHTDNLNSYSVGIELQGTGDNFPAVQMDSLTKVLIALHKEYSSIKEVIGHNDYAPGRKSDPGPNFDWDMVYSKLAESGINYE